MPAQELYQLEAAVQAHHTLLMRHGFAQISPSHTAPLALALAPSTTAETSMRGSGGKKLGQGAGQGRGAGQGHEAEASPIELFDFEGAMIDALQQ